MYVGDDSQESVLESEMSQKFTTEVPGDIPGGVEGDQWAYFKVELHKAYFLFPKGILSPIRADLLSHLYPICPARKSSTSLGQIIPLLRGKRERSPRYFHRRNLGSPLSSSSICYSWGLKTPRRLESRRGINL